MLLKTNIKADLDAETAEDWHPADIKAALNKAGYTLARLAEEYGLKNGSLLSKCLTQSLPTSERRIANAIGIEPEIIWPSRYDANGQRKLQGSRKLESSRRSVKHQISEARALVPDKPAAIPFFYDGLWGCIDAEHICRWGSQECHITQVPIAMYHAIHDAQASAWIKASSQGAQA